MQIETGNNQYKAAVTLAFAAGGFMVSRPFADSFSGGLVASICEAAMVGGLADWFAVTALFRRPLGIPWRTAIIPRQRDRIFQAIVDMVANELLSVANIQRTIVNYDWAGLAVDYLTSRGGRRYARALGVRLVRDAVGQFDVPAAAAFTTRLLETQARKVRLSPLLAEGLAWSAEHGYVAKVINFILARLISLVEMPQTNRLLAGLIASALADYEAGINRRRLFNRLIAGLAGLTPGQLANEAQQMLRNLLIALGDDQHPLRLKLMDRLQMLMAKLATDGGWKAKIQDWQQAVLAKVDFEPLINQLAVERQQALLAGKQPPWEATLVNYWNDLLTHFAASSEQRANFNRAITTVLVQWLESHHESIGSLIARRLEELDAEQLSSFIDAKVGNDLQMIRINGSIVGGLVGGLLFLLDYGLK